MLTSATIEVLAPSADARLQAFCMHQGIVPGDALVGGVISRVVVADAACGSRVVVKAADGETLASEVAWLRRHRSAPAVIEWCPTLGVVVLEHVGGVSLWDQPTLIDWDHEIAWIAEAEAATGALLGDEPDHFARLRILLGSLRDRDRDVDDIVDAIIDRLDVSLADRSDFVSVPIDVIGKNTLVSAHGQWRAIDPFCVAGPLAVLGCHWAVDRSFRTPGDALSIQQTFASLSSDPVGFAWWMPMALAWSWCWWPEDAEHHVGVLAALRYWLNLAER